MAAQLTRIFNNQITDNTIEWQKLKDGTLVGQKFNPDLTLNSNIVLQGNLTVSGDYIVRNSINTYINDPLVVFNNGYTDTPTYDIGMLINRNLAAASGSNTPYNISGGGYNAAWIWREADGAFEGLLTSETGNTAASINKGAFANLIIGNTIIRATAGSVVDSASTVTGALQVQGGVGITANINIGSTNTTWNKIAGNSYFGTTTLSYPSGTPTGQQAVQTIKTFTGTAFNQILIDSTGTYHASFTQNTAAQNNGLSVVTYQSGNDIRFSPNQIYSLSLAAANGSVIVQPTTDSTGADPYHTGALIVQGGTAVQGNLNVQGNASVAGLVIGSSALGVAGSYGASSMFIANVATPLTLGQNTIAIGLNIGQGGAIGNQNLIIGANVATAAGLGTNNTILGIQAGLNGSAGDYNTFVGALSGVSAQSSASYNTYIGYQAGLYSGATNYNVFLGSYDGQNNPYYPLNLSASNKNIVLSDGSGNIRIWVDGAGTTRITSNTIATHGDPTTGAMAIVGGLGVLGNLQIGGNAITIANGLVVGGHTSSGGGRIYIGGNVRTDSVGINSVVIGNYAGTTGTAANATILGDSAGMANPADSATLIGKHAGAVLTGAGGTMIGAQAGKFTTGQYNQFFGYQAGSQVTTGQYNVILGANDGTQIAALNNQIIISDGQGVIRMTVTSAGNTTITSTTQSTDLNSGALVVKGGAGINKDLYVGGNAVVSGNITVMGTFEYLNTTVTTVTDPIIELNTGPNGAALTGSVNYDVGIKARHWWVSAERSAFFGRSNDSGAFEYYAVVTGETGNVISGTYGNIRAGEFHSANTTQAGDKNGTIGAITTLGGASIARSLYVGDYSYISGVTNTGDYVQTTGGTIFNLSGTSTVTLNPATAAQVSTIDNISIGATTPANGRFSNLTVSGDGSGYNFTVQGSGFANISPTGAVKINPLSTNGQSSNMDNVYIGNITPRQAQFTTVKVNGDIQLDQFTANAVLFVSPSGNVSIDQQAGNFNYQRNTGNTFATTQLSIGTNGDFTGTDTLNIYYQGDSYVPQSGISANVLGQTPGWTTATSRGTGHTPLTVQSGDFAGLFGAYAYTDIGDYQEVGAWRYVVEGDHTTGLGLGGEAQLWTKREGVDGATLALRVDSNQVATFTGQVVIANTTGVSSTLNNASDGALYVMGTVGIEGNVVTSAGMRINDSMISNRDFIVRGSNDATLIWASTKSSYNQVVIGNSATSSTLINGAKLQVWSKDSMLLPVGAEADRPASPTAGMLRYSTTRGDMEFYNGADWVGQQAGQAGIWYDYQFVGNGVQTDFTMGRAGTTNGALVSINGIIQYPGSGNAYTISGNTVVFSEPPLSTDVIDIRLVSVPYTIRGLASTNANVELNVDDYGANIIAYTNRYIFTVANTGAVAYDGLGNTTVGTSAAIIDQWPKELYRSAKYYVQVSNSGYTQFETSEVLVIHDGTTATKTQYGRVYTGAASLGSVSTNIVGANVVVYYTGVSSANTVKTRAEYTFI